MLGQPLERTLEVLRRLRSQGAILLPGETPEKRRPGTVESGELDSGPIDREAPVELGELSADEERALAEDNELSEAARRRILAMRRKLGSDYFTLLGVEPGAGKRQLKRAYFRVSKEFHPDRYYGASLGSFGPWLSQIFKEATRAFNELSDERRRRAYEARMAGRGGQRAQTREEHAAELFERACDAEIGGDLEEALRLFGAACRTHPRARYVSRAARCALRADKLSVAEEYAKKAAGLRPKDPSYARLLADIYRASDRLEEAEATLLHAIELNSENDVLMAELSEDLEALKRARPTSGQRSRQ